MLNLPGLSLQMTDARPSGCAAVKEVVALKLEAYNCLVPVLCMLPHEFMPLPRTACQLSSDCSSRCECPLFVVAGVHSAGGTAASRLE